ncbi:MAG: xanthan lyase, partial [Calditrichales bacterium]
MDRITERIHKKVESFLETCVNDGDPIPLSRFVRIDSLIVDEETEHLDIYLNRFFSHPAYREENIQKIYAAVQDELGWWDSNYTFTIYTTNTKMEELVPNFYRSDSSTYDRTRLAIAPRPVVPLVRNQDKSWLSNGGLYGKHIALWHSHGWYYEPRLKRWEWQRARLFQSVEDLGPLSYTLGYIVPMLENAGANVFLPRERDMQTNEVIIDNDAYQTENMNYKESALNDSLGWKTAQTPGFAIGSPPYGAWVNPFKLGSARYITTRLDRTAAISWVPQIPEKGKYAVYVSYAMTDSSITDARYTVYHTGGKTEFKINQKMGGNTWVYLGEFVFREGTHPDSGKVVLTNESETPGGIVTADAVRFGGGMGNVLREGQVSGRPRYIEAARYYLQYAGMPDTLVYTPSSNRNDYTDDYRSRGEWVNYLKGAPYGPNSKRDERGLGIPIDISLAFHTDAGISKTDTVIGTLSIYSTFDADSSLYFPDGVSRFANRDFADILQSEIVEDIRREHDPVWNRRDLWDRGYSEAFRPNVPAALLELLSHQNFLDMKFFLDPQFRFTVSRSIYKSILKFLATQNGEAYVVQPLPVKNFLAVFEGPEQIYLRWDAQADPVEATAMPDKYILYTRVGDSEFDNGRLVNSNYTTISNLEANVIYGFKVTAANDGGESFPSEILSACRVENGGDPVLIINGFDRVSGPATVETDKFRGFANFIDAGVADKYDLNYTGSQFNFEPKNPWTDDDAPG